MTGDTYADNRSSLIALGEALHGRRWQNATAHDLDVDKRQVHRWVSGEYGIPDGVISDLCRVARRRVDTINAALAGSHPQG